MRDLFHVTLLNKKEYYSPDVNCVITDVSNLDFKLTSYAMEQNINEEHLSSLKDGWLKLSKVQVAFDRYNYKTSFISLFIFGFYIICWLNICYTFVDLSAITFMTSNPFGGFFTIIRRGFHTTQPRCYPRKAYYVHENFMNTLKEKTGGKYSPGHMVYGDTNASGSIELEGQLTSDKNNKVLDAKQISDTNLKGKNSPQKVVKFENPTSVPPSSVNVVPNSEAYFDHDSIKNSLDTLHSSKVNDYKE